MTVGLPTVAGILAARERHGGRVMKTPLIENEVLNRRLGLRLLIKAECLQHTGSFKIRGALNRLEALSTDERRRGVVAFSSGNHAQGVARAARWLGVDAVIVMPEDAPRMKIAGVERDGARIVLYDRRSQSREEISAQISRDEGRIIVPSYDDAYIVEGQGTCGLELAEQCDERGIVPDHVLCCAGGGGLIAGVSLAVKQAFPEAGVWSCEPEGYDDHRQSLAQGKRVRVSGKTHSICDAILTPEPGELTFEIYRKTLSGGLVVSEAEVLAAMRAAFENLKLVVEPGGAVAFASALHHLPESWSGRTVCVVLTGGNVDANVFEACLRR